MINLHQRLIEELKEFCADTGLPHVSADELIHHPPLKAWQRAYILDFSHRWDRADALEEIG